MQGASHLQETGESLLRELLFVASGKLTKAEVSGYVNSMDIWTLGPVV
jgi:altronate dehydratase large subunit